MCHDCHDYYEKEYIKMQLFTAMVCWNSLHQNKPIYFIIKLPMLIQSASKWLEYINFKG